jgi:hypothetical protein
MRVIRRRKTVISMRRDLVIFRLIPYGFGSSRRPIILSRCLVGNGFKNGLYRFRKLALIRRRSNEEAPKEQLKSDERFA